MYLTFDEYLDYGGTAITDELTFERISAKAEAEVNHRTFNRLKALAVIPVSVKRCLFEMIEYINNSEQAYGANGGAITSTSNDGVSVSYANATDFYVNIYPAHLCELMDMYLSNVAVNGTNVMYRGV